MERIKLAVEKAREQSLQIGRPAKIRPPTADADPTSHIAPPLVPERSSALDARHLTLNRIVGHERNGLARTTFDLLRTQVLQKMQEHGWKTIAITSPTVDSGKTMVAINLALTMAQHPELSVILADFDLRRPKVGEYLGIAPGPSLAEVLEGTCAAGQALVDVGVPRLSVMTAARRGSGAAELLAANRSSEVIGQFERSASITIVDLPPVTAVDDVIAMLPWIDCVLLVVGNGMSTRREIQETQRHLARANVIGYVLNKAATLSRSQTYY